MPATKKPRKRYRPKAKMLNVLEWVCESVQPVAAHDSYLVDVKIRNSQSMLALMQGKATRQDMNVLIAMSNVCEALVRMGFGKEYATEAMDGRAAILAIVMRAPQVLRFTPKAEEIKALQLLMELHDAQMEVITVRDMERALELVKQEIKHRKASVIPDFVAA